MADTPRRPKKSRHEIDISTRQSGPKFGWRGNAVVLGVMLTLFLALYYFQLSPWVLLAIIPIVILLFVAWIAWIVLVRRGVLTWMKLAMKPAKLMAAGDTAGAEAACEQALAKARSFPPEDHRRGIMLCELAMFVKNQGRQAEAIALYEESIDILAKDAAREPMDYFVGLNNYGICFIHTKDYEAAQRLLEKAIDMILASRKREINQFKVMALQQVQALEFVLHLNLAFLFLEMREFREAELHLRDADALAPLLSKKMQQNWKDHYVAMCALWEFEAGNIAQAEKEIAEANNPDYPACLRVRARLHMVRSEFAKAEQLLRKYQAEEKKKGVLHRPDLLKATLDFAEALYGQGKHREGLAEFEEARSIVADFKLPGDAAWGKTLEHWLPRVRQSERKELADSLEKEIAQISTTPSKAIMILEKFKFHREDA